MATEEYTDTAAMKEAQISAHDTKPSGGFECNICLDTVQDPVVTLCGHLYCWPCIYKWHNLHPISTETQTQKCPVCKSQLSLSTLVPIYAKGQTRKPTNSKAPNLGIVIPRRLQLGPPCDEHDYQITRRTPRPRYQTPAEFHGVDPIVGGFGEMVCARLFGNMIGTNWNGYSYNGVANGSPRLRRHIMRAEESLGRIWFFLFCCALFCLLLF